MWAITLMLHVHVGFIGTVVTQSPRAADPRAPHYRANKAGTHAHAKTTIMCTFVLWMFVEICLELISEDKL